MKNKAPVATYFTPKGDERRYLTLNWQVIGILQAKKEGGREEKEKELFEARDIAMTV